MSDRPILFSTLMVRAILEGRKTQTRRGVNTKGLDSLGPCGNSIAGDIHLAGRDWSGNSVLLRCPYGQPGDLLWVKETWQAWRYCSMEYDEWCLCDCPPSEILERFGTPKLEYAATTESFGPWRPSIHMPRWASRITLKIVSVRIERLLNISNEDCWDEGMCDATNPEVKANRKWFSELWESINGPGSWNANPWVWVIQFKKVKP